MPEDPRGADAAVGQETNALFGEREEESSFEGKYPVDRRGCIRPFGDLADGDVLVPSRTKSSRAASRMARVTASRSRSGAP